MFASVPVLLPFLTHISCLEHVFHLLSRLVTYMRACNGIPTSINHAIPTRGWPERPAPSGDGLRGHPLQGMASDMLRSACLSANPSFYMIFMCVTPTRGGGRVRATTPGYPILPSLRFGVTVILALIHAPTSIDQATSTRGWPEMSAPSGGGLRGHPLQGMAFSDLPF